MIQWLPLPALSLMLATLNVKGTWALTLNHLAAPTGMVRSLQLTLDQPDEEARKKWRQALKEQWRREHRDFLNNDKVWWLMGSVVALVGIAIISLETNSHTEPTQRPAQGQLEAGQKEQEAEEAGPPGGFSRRDLAHLAFCVVAINVSMVLWGIAQEYLMTHTYRDGHGHHEMVPNSLLLVLSNRLVSMVFAFVLLLLMGKPVRFDGFLAGALPSVTNCASSWSQYKSLEFISFPLQSTAKAAKLLPVIVLGSLRGKRYTLLDYAEVVVMVAGLIVFGAETDGRNKPMDTTEIGILLLGLYLVMDSCTPHLQDHVFDMHPNLDPLQMTWSMSCFGALGCALIMLINGSIYTSVIFLCHFPSAILQMTVLSLASTVSQYTMVYTVKHFGPMLLTLIISTRQLISVCLSDLLFRHSMTGLAVVAVLQVLGTIMIRTFRLLPVGPGASGGSPNRAAGLGRYRNIFVCAVAIHVLYAFYALAQEFLSVHTFDRHVFQFPVFVIAVNHTCGALLALVSLRITGQPVLAQGLHLTTLPALADFVSTYLQHQALYYIFFPAQTLMKTLKLIPVMLVGRLLKNRTYTWLDYLEGMLITGLVAYFVWSFQMGQGTLRGAQFTSVIAGLLMMVGYICSDSFLSNLEDYAYQVGKLDAGQMLFGLEFFSASAGWLTLVASGQLVPALHFLVMYKAAILYVALQAWASAAGAYSCTLTVRLYGPAVFTLLMMSRQVLSLVISVAVFNHTILWVDCLCLVAVSALILTSSLRRVSAQIAATEPDAAEGDRRVCQDRNGKLL